ncbi:hypothetical protein HK105_202519 [Polyrhizophydium stewartii]|uniref:PNPLA domain-containing protein n=1 Tax=Polyrhizophydium stewartii TaxID=2732419 RepID=A0ABR4NF38_9FUNG
MYIAVRQWVSWTEFLFNNRGVRYKLFQRLRNARSYKEWAAAAKEIDAHLGVDAWKESSRTDLVDVKLLRSIVRRLRRYRAQSASNPHAIVKLCNTLRNSCCKNNVAGIDNEEIYRFTHFGTMRIVEEYVIEVIQSLEFASASPLIAPQEKYKLFRGLSRTFGRTALCLSGGATFGYIHLGVIKALLDMQLVPSVITGTSAGSLMGAMLAVRTDEEMRDEVFTPALVDHLTMCADPLSVRIRRFLKTGAVFDFDDWFAKGDYLVKGTTTFLEAFRRTDRIFSITVVSNEPNAEPKLLNYLTAPDVVIASAIIASSSIPGLLPPVQLICKTASGELKPFRGVGTHWRDGSLRTDIPQHELHQLFNVNYTVVSQVNPHVSLFFFNPRGGSGSPSMHRRGHGWRGGFIASAMIQYLLLDLQKWLAFVRDMHLLPRIMCADLSNLWLQRFEGSVTIIPPRPRLTDYLYLVSDPTPERLARHIRNGQIMTFPKIQMIANRLRVEQTLERLTREARRLCLAVDPSLAVAIAAPRNHHAASVSSALSDADGPHSLQMLDIAAISSAHSTADSFGPDAALAAGGISPGTDTFISDTVGLGLDDSDSIYFRRSRRSRSIVAETASLANESGSYFTAESDLASERSRTPTFSRRLDAD